MIDCNCCFRSAFEPDSSVSISVCCSLHIHVSIKRRGADVPLHVGGIAVAKRLANTLTAHQVKGAARICVNSSMGSMLSHKYP